MLVVARLASVAISASQFGMMAARMTLPPAGKRELAFDALRNRGTDIQHFCEVLNSQQLLQAFPNSAH